MQNKTNHLICDECGKIIGNTEEGFVEWYKNEGDIQVMYKGIRIVHDSKCDYERKPKPELNISSTAGMNLNHFSGPDGLMKLLLLINSGDFSNNEELLEIIKRIHIPGYEEVRSHLGKAKNEGMITPNGNHGYPTQEEIATVLRCIKNK